MVSVYFTDRVTLTRMFQLNFMAVLQNLRWFALNKIHWDFGWSNTSICDPTTPWLVSFIPYTPAHCGQIICTEHKNEKKLTENDEKVCAKQDRFRSDLYITTVFADHLRRCFDIVMFHFIAHGSHKNPSDNSLRFALVWNLGAWVALYKIEVHCRCHCPFYSNIIAGPVNYWFSIVFCLRYRSFAFQFVRLSVRQFMTRMISTPSPSLSLTLVT